MKSVYAFFILIIFFNLLYAQSSDSIVHADSVVDKYKLGYATGEALGKKSTFMEQNTLGFIAGCGGSCMGFLLANGSGWKISDDHPNMLVIPTILGGVVTGGLLFYSEIKDKNIPFDTLAVDSLFFAGFKDGYIKISKSERLINVAAGCCGGIAIVTVIVLWGIATFSNIEL